MHSGRCGAAQAIDAEQFHIASSHLVDREVVAAPLQEPYAEELSGERTRGAARGSRMRLSGMRGSFAQTSQDRAAGLASVVRLKRWMNKALFLRKLRRPQIDKINALECSRRR